MSVNPVVDAFHDIDRIRSTRLQKRRKLRDGHFPEISCHNHVPLRSLPAHDVTDILPMHRGQDTPAEELSLCAPVDAAKRQNPKARIVMNKIGLTAAVCLLLAGCTTDGTQSTPGPGFGAIQTGPRLQPIPGSITYGGQPRTRLTKAPIGSIVQHEFRNEFGELTQETYVVQPDRSLKLSTRRVIRTPFGNDDP
jgi:hypothetical protein